MVNPRDLKNASLGRHIFVYSNIRTNQVVYSLTRTLKNNACLRQLPFLGKKTVPASLRKDLWQPLATISFPQTRRGLQALRKLREYRKLHELSYPLEDFKSEKNEHAMLGKKARGRKLMDQKANSIADIAAVLKQQEEEGRVWRERASAQESSGDTKRSSEATAPSSMNPEEDGAPVKIQWKDILDAEYAESWPPSVLHDELGYSGHTAPLPA